MSAGLELLRFLRRYSNPVFFASIMVSFTLNDLDSLGLGEIDSLCESRRERLLRAAGDSCKTTYNT